MQIQTSAGQQQQTKPPTYVYKGYIETTVPVIKPDLPEPYKTFSDIEPY